MTLKMLVDVTEDELVQRAAIEAITAPVSNHPKLKHLEGMTFGRLRVVAPGGMTRSGAKWVCVCDCGVVKQVAGVQLRNGHSTSCGCYQVEVARGVMTKHGHASGQKSSTTFNCWTNMKTRCFNPKHPSYEQYGGRGITVCQAWLQFEGFLADMGECPEGLTLDRFPDINGNYEPGNCRWATWKEQQNNKRSNHIIRCMNEEMTLTEFASRHQIAETTLRARIKVGVRNLNGLSFESIPSLQRRSSKGA